MALWQWQGQGVAAGRVSDGGGVEPSWPGRWWKVAVAGLRHHGVVIHGWLPTAGAANERNRTSESRVTTVCIEYYWYPYYVIRSLIK